MRNRTSAILLGAAVAACFLMGATADAAREVQGERSEADSGDLAASRLLTRAEELLTSGERERGIKMLETIIEQNPKSKVRFKAYLALGRHFFEVHEQTTAIEYLRVLTKLKTSEDEVLSDEDLEMYLESLYLTGVANFQMRQYGAAFSILRKITGSYPNTVWANQAYYYIGMSHFAQENWSKAIAALGLVGTFVDPESPEIEYVEAGHRFYVKIVDGDLPILDRLGKSINVNIKTKSGDKETVPCAPLAGNTAVFLGSVPTEVSTSKPGDGILQVVGGDSIASEYVDDNTKDGKKDVVRLKDVKVVSNASVKFTLGTYESTAPAAFLGQPLFIKLRDVDLDTGPQADETAIVISSMYKSEEEEDAGVPIMTVDIDKLLKEGEKRAMLVRDEVTLTLKETGTAPVHSGIFVGSIEVAAVPETGEVNKSDKVLSCTVGDEVVATYTDRNHTGGDVPATVVSKLTVSGEIDSSPRAAQNIVPDPVVRARKELVEAEAYLELARIFKSMGLMDGAKEKAEEGLSRVNFAIKTKDQIPTALREHAFQLKWELSLAQDDFQGAMATCQVFNRLYPESPLVDNALMGIGRVYMDRKKPEEAARVFQQVLALPESHSKAEAQYLIATLSEKGKNPESAVQQYKLVAKKYPDSQYAGLALGKVIDYHIEAKDYMVADDLLEQVFMDYQDVDFLDSMLLKWVLVAYRMGNHQKAYEKASQLIFEYPGSSHAEKAKAILPKIEQKLGKTNEE